MRRRHIVMAAALAALATTGALVAAAAPANASPSYNKYVALGDSYAAVGSVWDVSGTPGCFRSASNYAHDLAKDLGVGSLTDETCSSAVTDDMTQPQNTGQGTNPPQFDGLTADTDLVTVTIGGNDFGFGTIATTCATLSPIGNPCQQHYTVNGVDQLAASIGPVAAKVGAVIQGIKQRAPQAKIVVVGYLPIMPPQNGCWPSIPIANGDATWLYGIQRQLDAAIAAEAVDNGAIGAIGVDPSGITGHDACQLPWVRWVEPVLGIPPLHPNVAGQSNLASLIATKL